MNLQNELTNRADIFSKYWQKYLEEGKPVTLYKAGLWLVYGRLEFDIT